MFDYFYGAQSDQFSFYRVTDQENYNCPDCRNDQRCTDSLPDSVKASCTIILPAIGRHGRTKHTVWQRHEFKYFSSCRVSHNDCCSKSINGRLQQNRSNADQTGHQPHRQSAFIHFCHQLPVKSEILFLYMQNREFPENTNQT